MNNRNADGYECRFSPATVADLPCLQALAKDVIVTRYAAFLGADVAETYLASGQSDHEIADGLRACVVLWVDEEPVGFAITRGACLHLLMIALKWQRRGYGARLLRYVEQQLFQEFPVLTLQSFRANEPANRFYLKHGWIATGSEIKDGSGVELLRFAKAENA